MRIIAWCGLILYSLIAFLYFVGVLIFDEEDKRIEALVKLLFTSPLVYFFFRYLF